MRLGVFGWSAVAGAVVASLAAIAVRRPISDALTNTGLRPSFALGASSRELVRWVPVAQGLSQPVDIQFVPGQARQIVVLEKGGRARWIELLGSEASAAPATTPASAGGTATPGGVDVVTLAVHSHSELGLLGLAFHPRYTENGLFYLNHNPRDGGPLRTRISEWQLPAPLIGKQAARESRTLLEIDQPYANHDGGQLAFGTDGYLYVGMGDGGSRADPQNHGQNLQSLLGKMLRIDVNSSPGYAIPPDNPFTHAPGVRPEIWAYGLRNPWRFSFDPAGRLIAADVGQDDYEEVDWVGPGDNLGWKVREAAHCFAPRESCPSTGLVDPIFEYDHSLGSSITGGHVYLGRELPWLAGKYVLADFVSGRVWALELPERRGDTAQARELGRFPHAISAFARDADGELYALDFALGLVLRLAPA